MSVKKLLKKACSLVVIIAGAFAGFMIIGKLMEKKEES